MSARVAFSACCLASCFNWYSPVLLPYTSVLLLIKTGRNRLLRDPGWPILLLDEDDDEDERARGVGRWMVEIGGNLDNDVLARRVVSVVVSDVGIEGGGEFVA